MFGVVRGVLLVGIAFLVYDRAVAANTVPMVDNSRSAKIFASFQGDINAAVPTDAPNWVVARYNELTATCARETTAVATNRACTCARNRSVELMHSRSAALQHKGG